MSNIIIKDTNGNICELDKNVVTSSITPEQFLDADEIAEQVILNVDIINLRFIQNLKHNELIQLHMTIGLWIRNTFCLWNDNYPWTNGGLVDDGEHPDNYSFAILEQIWNMLNSDKNILGPVTSMPFKVI